MHALLFSRFRVVCTAPGKNGGSEGLSQSLTSNPELKKHLNGVLLPLSTELWNVSRDARVAHQRLIEQVLDRQDKLERVEMKKYSGLKNLKENDVPGIRRVGVEERVERLGRDRGDDELARLINKHEHDDDDDEPGVD